MLLSHPTPASRLSTLTLLAVAILGLACQSAGPPPGAGSEPGDSASAAEEETIPVEVGTATLRDMTALYSTSATLRAERRATVTTRTSGVLRVLKVEEGARVREGQALAELENDEQKIALTRAQDTAATKEREFQRLDELFQQALVSEEQFEQARRAYQDAQHGADLARLELTRTVIIAPFGGVVLKRYLDVGNTVTQGTAVYDLADLDPLYTDVNVPERHVGLLSAGQEVLLTPDATNQSVAAKIERIAPEVDRTTGTVKVTLAVNEGQDLRPGTFVRVDITTDQHDQSLVVPRSALVAEGRRWYLFKVTDGAVSRVEVSLGYEDGQHVEVNPLHGETLSSGNQVVTAGAATLEEGSKIRVAQAAGTSETEPDDSQDATDTAATR
ncbi:MAG: efflux RND transporter periplasmic adaptor subunit [Thermoanaerobaculia bacterium]|nr:efflux RND transporter periplasmic adaptor subunit [Thermoanaerobaculia bacterium]